jgi:hypothetical protein
MQYEILPIVPVHRYIIPVYRYVRSRQKHILIHGASQTYELHILKVFLGNSSHHKSLKAFGACFCFFLSKDLAC